MAEGLGRRARWTAALVAAPGAAALFGVATSWAVHATPATGATTPKGSQAQPGQGSDAAVLGAQRSATANRKQLSTLERQLAVLRAQLAAMIKTTSAGSSSSAGSAAAAGSGGAAGGSPGSAAGAAHPPAPSPAASPSSAPP